MPLIIAAEATRVKLTANLQLLIGSVW